MSICNLISLFFIKPLLLSPVVTLLLNLLIKLLKIFTSSAKGLSRSLSTSIGPVLSTSIGTSTEDPGTIFSSPSAIYYINIIFSFLRGFY